jgi:hypothetical protein
MGRKKRAQEKANQAEVTQTQQEAAGAISGYRPFQQQAYNEGLQQILGMFQGRNNLMADMYGDKATQMRGADLGGLVSPSMMGVGATGQAPGFAPDTPGMIEKPPPGPVGTIEGRRIDMPELDIYKFPEQQGPVGGTGEK